MIGHPNFTSEDALLSVVGGVCGVVLVTGAALIYLRRQFR